MAISRYTSSSVAGWQYYNEWRYDLVCDYNIMYHGWCGAGAVMSEVC